MRWWLEVESERNVFGWVTVARMGALVTAAVRSIQVVGGHSLIYCSSNAILFDLNLGPYPGITFITFSNDIPEAWQIAPQ